MTRTRMALAPGVLASLLSVAMAGFAGPSVGSGSGSQDVAARPAAAGGPAPVLFKSADRCQACHNGLTTPSGEDVSLGVAWRASMMAHSSRDPYWQAAVRREVLDHPSAAAAIERECSRCHMPMAHVTELTAGASPSLFANLPPAAAGPQAALAADGVSCTVCHQIQAANLGTPESFTGHFTIDTTTPAGQRPVYGPFAVEEGLKRVMHSATEFLPAEGAHIRSSEMCATCHTLYTEALDARGNVVGRLPEQVPYLEWRHSAYRETQSCQACHMPVVREPVRISSTLGRPREGVARHSFRGGNFWMLKVLNRYRDDLGVTTLPQELEAAVRETIAHLREDTADLAIGNGRLAGGRLSFDVQVTNRTGHKLPTAYPSRRAWLHVVVRDAGGAILFESGAVEPSGRITGNDNDRDAAAFEPHHVEISSPEQVQIYESVLGDPQGAVTTGLLTGVRYLKDNRLLPRGFDKTTAGADVAVRGGAASDGDFAAAGDRVRYTIAVPAGGPLAVTAELLYQSVGFRWAHNLRQRPSPETDRFVRYYESMSHSTAEWLARAEVRVP